MTLNQAFDAASKYMKSVGKDYVYFLGGNEYEAAYGLSFWKEKPKPFFTGGLHLLVDKNTGKVEQYNWIDYMAEHKPIRAITRE